MDTATTKWVSGNFFRQYSAFVEAQGRWPRINFTSDEQNYQKYLSLEANFPSTGPSLTLYERSLSSTSRNYAIQFPQKSGTITLSTDYTVVDGYLKKSSPIIQIYPDGTFTTNDESEGATVERLSEGVYLIKNVLGFNADAAWGGVDGGVEIPLCKNKLPLIWVDYRVLPDGSIKIMTYHREHTGAPAFARNTREGYVDGDPIDIPVGRSIAIRVQMPENSIWNQQQRKLTESE
ncbi:hypothetical protein [Xenorhabdus eapokensis]|uniref:Phage tail protein C-terminal domain-containing protein n=1 Tax=Xenorhabdus eapokensis TaxID=1873482 RepID=A0A1Q5TUN7_9GAMM|nr:hypothetical protein [Xenorhabdus eapokensis]OKP03934.1 hypothetical protein Xedl_01453 [Xenorhabdus eapokensis]